MHKAAWIVLLLVAAGMVPFAVPQAAPPIEVTVEAVAWEYGPEGWKGQPDHLQSLGLRLSVTAKVQRSGQDLPSDWEYTATLGDGAQEVAGIVQAAGSGRLRLMFDVDGSRASAFGTPIPPLTAGLWDLRIDAASPGTLPGQSQFEGWGAATVPARSVGWQQLEFLGPDTGGWVPLAGGAVPAGVLPGIPEVGAGPTWFADPMLGVGNQVHAALDVGEPGIAVHWTGWVPAPAFLPFLTEPFESIPLGTTRSGPDGVARQFIGATGASHLMVVAAHVDDPQGGGAAAFVLGTGDEGPRITTINPPAPGTPGPLAVTATGAGGGTVYALDGPRLLSQGAAALPTGPDETMALLDPTPLRVAAVSSYRLLVMAHQFGTGYAGHQVLHRGIAVEWQVPVMGAEREAELGVSFRSLTAAGAVAPGLSIPFNATVSFDQRLVGSADLDLPAGGVITRTWSVLPDSAGAARITVDIDSGDLRFSDGQTVQVLTGEEHDRQTAPWYSPGRYTPAPLPILAILGVALLVHTRKR